MFVVTLYKPDGSGFRRFDVELENRTGTALDFRAEAGEIHYWRGHLVVVVPGERKALHFSLPDTGKQVRTADAPLVSASDVAEVDSMLRSKYELTRIDKAVAITSLGGPRALEAGRELRSRIAPDLDYQDPGSGGIGSCGSTCTTRCGDGSSCSATCNAPRCASCSCPASCSCS